MAALNGIHHGKHENRNEHACEHMTQNTRITNDSVVFVGFINVGYYVVVLRNIYVTKVLAHVA